MNSSNYEIDLESSIVGHPLPEVMTAHSAEQYGALWLAARYCGLGSPPSQIPGEWQHGWLPEYMNWHPEGIVGTDGISRHRRSDSWQFVARKDQEKTLTDFGYTKAVAIGHSLVYATPPSVDRLPNSLLVMPVHSIATTEHKWNFDEYAEEIRVIASEYEKVVICVSPSCIEKGYWVDAFRNRGFSVISGANFFDTNAYIRMAILFQRFEFTTTNGFGSHIAYAQYFGSKTSIFGAWPDYHKIDFENDLFYQRCPELLDFEFTKANGERQREAWPWLFCEPSMGIADRDWAEIQLGKSERMEPRELMDLFGWNQTPFTRIFNKAVKRIATHVRSIRRNIHRLADFPLSLSLVRENRNLTKVSRIPEGKTADFNVFGKSFKVSNGSQAAREYRVYHGKSFGHTKVNPPTAPFIDFIVNDGIALYALSRSLQDRPVHVLNHRETSFNDNRHIWPSINLLDSIIPSSEGKVCCAKVKWICQQIMDGSIGKNIASAGIIRVALCAKCAPDFFTHSRSYVTLSLLLIEYHEPCSIDADLTLLAAQLSDAGFQVKTASIVYLSPGAEGSLSQHHLTHIEAIRYGESQRTF